MIGRLLAALPDALTAAAYVYAWVLPLDYRPDLVKQLMLVMLMEFLVVHSSAFFGVTIYSTGLSRSRKTLAIAGLALFYLLFVGGFCLAFKEVWPLYAFSWLVLSKFLAIWTASRDGEDEAGQQMSLWASSVVFYLFGAFATTILPVPQLGIDSEVVPQLGLSGGGLWIEQPQTVIAFGALYFTLMSLSKLLNWRANTRIKPVSA